MAIPCPRKRQATLRYEAGRAWVEMGRDSMEGIERREWIGREKEPVTTCMDSCSERVKSELAERDEMIGDGEGMLVDG